MIRSNGVNRLEIWRPRLFLSLVIFVAAAYIADHEHVYGENVYFSILGAGALLILVVFAWPADEIALDDNKFYYVSRSMLPWFTQTTAYKISALEHVHYRKYFAGSTTAWGVRRKKYRCTVELHFKSGKTRLLHLGSHQREIYVIIKQTNQLIDRKTIIHSTRPS